MARPETAGLGGDPDPVEIPAVKDTARDPRNDFITQLDTLHAGSLADQGCRVSAREHEGRGRHGGDAFTHLFRGDEAARNPQDHVLAASERLAKRFPRGGVEMEQHGGPFCQE